MSQKAKYWISLISLGYMGGMIYVLPYIRYTFYTQMMESMNITNTQVGFLSTVYALLYAASGIPGGMVADRFDAKKIILFSIGGTTIATFVHAFFATSYPIALIVWVVMGFTTGFAYWPALQKYILSMDGEGSEGGAYGKYYLINGLSGALGNAIPLWVASSLNAGYGGVIMSVGVMKLIATVLIALFLETEEDKKARGVVMPSDEPPRLADVGYVIKWPGTWLFFFVSSVCMYGLYAQISYLTPYLTDVVGIEPGASSLVSILRTYVTMLLAPVGGILADKVFHATSKLISISAVLIGVLIAGVFMFGPDSNPTVVALYTVLPALIIMPTYSVRYSILRELHIPPQMTGTAIGVMLLLPVGDGLYPLLFGHLLDKYGNQGYTYILYVLIALCVILLISTIIVRRHDRLCKEGKRHIRGKAYLAEHPEAVGED